MEMLKLKSFSPMMTLAIKSIEAQPPEQAEWQVAQRALLFLH